jgi:hypothetical protein
LIHDVGEKIGSARKDMADSTGAKRKITSEWKMREDDSGNVALFSHSMQAETPEFKKSSEP